jgi:hypothetical protein|tara:strand:+ start:87 stop:452 length:366 start_codon:yes stop_codon:yes gene_type:complete
MATLTPTLSFSSSDTSSDTLSFSVTTGLTVTQPMIDIARISISQSAATEIITTSQTLRTYVYIKNTDTTNFVKVSTAGGTTFGVLNPAEFMFFPLFPDTGFELQADTAACVVEYGYWTKPA